MTSIAKEKSGRASAREVAVWDPLVRLVHWSLALTILLNPRVHARHPEEEEGDERRHSRENGEHR